MAHGIETHGNHAAAIFARTDPWHRLGTTVRGRAFTATEAMELGHLGGWQVRKVPLSAAEPGPDGVHVLEVPGYATVRTNPFTGQPEALGVVGAGYTPIQNEEHADFLTALTDESGAVFDTAGSLHGGRQVFVTMALPESMHVGGTDQVDLNIAALNSHDGSRAFTVLLTLVRVVCANTQAAALADHVSAFKVRHTRNARAAVATAREVLGLSFAYSAAFEAQAEALIDTTMTEAAFNDLIGQVFPTAPTDVPKRVATAHTRRQHTLHALFNDAETQAVVRGTAWAGYQAITEYVDK